MGTTDSGTALFLSILPTAETIQAQRTSLANNQLIAGVRMLQKSRTEDAVSFFKKALALDSSSVDAYNYLGNAYLKLNKNEDAIATFKKLVAMKPFDSNAATSLGNAYSQAKQWTNAADAYKKATKLDPSNTTAIYSNGQANLLNNKLRDAAEIFQKLIRLKPNDPNGYYALGQTYNKMGNYDAAISNLKKAVSLKHEFFSLAEVELGYSYAGKGKDDLVQRQIDRLNANNETTAANELESDTLKPQITSGSAGVSNTFYPSLGPNTSLDLLTITDPNHTLSQPNATKSFSMDFQFNTDMDVASVQNIANWQISKANGGEAGYYNYGYTKYPDREASLPMIQNITYNIGTQLATVTFSLKQNATANAVIDPSHLVFKFSGKDVNGKSMDPTANAFEGARGVIAASSVSYYG